MKTLLLTGNLRRLLITLTVLTFILLGAKDTIINILIK